MTLMAWSPRILTGISEDSPNQKIYDFVSSSASTTENSIGPPEVASHAIDNKSEPSYEDLVETVRRYDAREMNPFVGENDRIIQRALKVIEDADVPMTIILRAFRQAELIDRAAERQFPDCRIKPWRTREVPVYRKWREQIDEAIKQDRLKMESLEKEYQELGLKDRADAL